MANSSAAILNRFTATFTELRLPIPGMDILKSFIDPPLEAGFALTPNQAVMIGDTHFDMIGGKSVGTQTLGVTWGFGTEQALLDSCAQFIAHTPADIQKLLAD